VSQELQHEQRVSRDSAIKRAGIVRASLNVMSSKRIVYIIRSRRDPARHYIGLTADLPARLASHNAGESPQTQGFVPWALVVSVQFASEDAAGKFVRYLKSASGRDFAKRYFGCE
jgi:predicted GIY-YIG superfamily endonuclease